MTRGERNNIAASVRQRLLNQARESHADFNLILTRYGLERFLYRLGQPSYRNRFILKGAMLFPLWGVINFRGTRAVDLLGFGENDKKPWRSYSANCARLRLKMTVSTLTRIASKPRISPTNPNMAEPGCALLPT